MSRTIDISNNDDVIDSRDVIERIAQLEDEKESFILEYSALPEEDAPSWGDVLEAQTDAESKWDETDEGQELKALQGLAEEAEGYAADWKYGETLIRDSYFEDYAKELARDIGAINDDAHWPNNCIDWEEAASELQVDYTSVEFSGVTYWIRMS
jgi:hypothetical protein